MPVDPNEKVYIIPSFDGGMQRKSTSFLTKQSELFLGKNIDLQYILGAISKCLGYDQKGDAIAGGAAILGCGALNTSGGTDKLLAFAGTDAYIYNSGSGAWDAQSRSYSASQLFEIALFLDELFEVNGLTDAPENFNGAAWSTTNNVTEMPKSKFIILYEGLLFLFHINIAVGGTFASRVWYCNLPKNNAIVWNFESGTDLATTADSAVVTSAGSVFKTRGIKIGDTFTITTGSDAGQYEVLSIDSNTQITLTEDLTATDTNESFWVGGNFFDVARDNSDVGMGIGKNDGRLLLYKRFSLHRFLKTQDASTDQLEPVKGVPGTVAHRSITNLRKYTFYAADSGIWRYDGADSVLVSTPMEEVWDGIAAANLNNIVGWTVKDRLLKMFVGDVSNTATGLTIDKCVIVHDPFAGTWWVESLADNINCATTWIESSAKKRVAFTDAGKALETESGNDFDDEPIDMEVELPFHFPIAPEVELNFTRFKVYTKEGRAISYSYKLAYFQEKKGFSVDSDWIPLGVKNQTEHETNLVLSEKENKACGFALKFRENSIRGRPAVTRVAAYYTGGALR